MGYKFLLLLLYYWNRIGISTYRHSKCDSTPRVPNPRTTKLCYTSHGNIYLFYTHTYVEVGLVLCQGYVPEEHHTNQTQNSHLKQCVSRLGD